MTDHPGADHGPSTDATYRYRILNVAQPEQRFVVVQGLSAS